MADEAMNLISLTPRQIIRLITEAIETGDYSPMLMLGKAGVGKTVTVTDVAKRLNIGYKELRLVNMSEIDTYGLPAVVEVDVVNSKGEPVLNPDGSRKKVKKTMYIPPSLLPDAEVDGEEGILALDEITSCSRTVRAAAYQLLDSKRALGDYKLPPKWKVIALGNGEADGGVFEGMEGAFLTRCTACRFEADTDSWISWAMNNGINGAVLGYIKQAPDRIYVLPPGAEVDGRLFPCPRTWEKLSTKLNLMEARRGEILSQEDVVVYAGTSIGASIAHEFAAFYAYNNDTVNPGDILDGKIGIKEAAKRLSTNKVKQEVLLLSLSRLTQLYMTRQKAEIERLGTGRDWMKLAMFSDRAYEDTIKICQFAVAIGSECRNDLTLSMISDLSKNCEAFQEIVIMMSGEFGNQSYIDQGGKKRNFDDDCPEFKDFCDNNGLQLGGYDL